MSISTSVAKNRARDLIARVGILAPPIPVERIAQNQGITVQHVPLDDELSGMAFVTDGRRYIVVNAGHHPNRQRFTIAHELAHHILHYEYLEDGIHVDKIILNRDVLSSKGVDEKEKSANAFAAELLMPEALLRPLLGRGLDLNDEDVVESLARTFRVSVAALNYRLFLPTATKQGKLPLGR